MLFIITNTWRREKNIVINEYLIAILPLWFMSQKWMPKIMGMKIFWKDFFSVEKWVCCQFLDATSFSWSLYRNYATCRLKIYGIKNNGKGILELASNNLAFSPKFFCMLEASKFQITLHGWIDRPYMNFWSRGFLPWNYVNSLENFSSSSSLHNKKIFKKSFFKGLLSHCDPAHYCLFKTWYDPSGQEPFVLDKNFSFSSSITSAADKSFICSKSRCFSCIFDASFDRLIMNNFSAEFVLIFMHIHNLRIIQLGSVRKTTLVHFFSWQISGLFFWQVNKPRFLGLLAYFTKKYFKQFMIFRHTV